MSKQAQPKWYRCRDGKRRAKIRVEVVFDEQDWAIAQNASEEYGCRGDVRKWMEARIWDGIVRWCDGHHDHELLKKHEQTDDLIGE